ncbi:MAG: 2-amino-4-hydroxy-6-hydroxymethyldihydropteridine diphosphokinase [Halioglobus sp.]
MSTAYIALGSNLENPAKQLQDAINAIAQWEHSSIEAISKVYSSSAVGPGNQPDYLNAVAKITTRLSPSALLEHLQMQETAQGRIRTEHWGPRTLDLDILLFDNLQISTQSLEIPHPAMKERNFVLYPLADIVKSDMMLPCGSDLGTLLQHTAQNDLACSDISLNYNFKSE